MPWSSGAFAPLSSLPSTISPPAECRYTRTQRLARQVVFLVCRLFGIAVAIGIVGLAFRRFVVRPRWLGKVSYESGLIAFLIFLLMVTYLATFFARWEESRVLWWIHTLTILVFLPLIPHTKHLHLVLSPFTIFLKRDSSARSHRLRRRRFRARYRQGLTSWSLQAYSCVECGRCTEHCPAQLTPARF